MEIKSKTAAAIKIINFYYAVGAPISLNCEIAGNLRICEFLESGM